MSSTSPSRTRLHPAAITALVVGGALILAAIAFLAWVLNSQQSTDADDATKRLVQWQEVFEKYREAHGALPDVPDGGYCLGTGFPVGTGGTANCRDYGASANYYTEEASAPLLEALATAADLPQGVSTPVRGTIGPYAIYEGATVRLLTAEDGACEAPAEEVWNDGGGLFICQVLLQR